MYNNQKKIKCLVFIACFFIAGKAIAQPFTLDSINVTKLELYDYKPADTKVKGRLNVTTVTQVKDTMYYFVNGVSSYAPTYVSVTADDKSKPIDVRLHKWNWHDVLRSGTTDANGHWEDKFRTETDFGIMVICKDKPATYVITVWTGEEAKPDLPSAFSDDKKDAAAAGGSNFFKKNWMYLVIGLLVIVIAILFLKRKKS
jgi:hypothetical protein